MSKFNKTLLFLNIIILSAVLFIGAALTWTEPASAPPTGNVSAPLNTGIQAQAKSGGLIINASKDTGIEALITYGESSVRFAVEKWEYIKDTAVGLNGVVSGYQTPRATCDIDNTTVDCGDTIYESIDRGNYVYDQFYNDILGGQVSVQYIRNGTAAIASGGIGRFDSAVEIGKVGLGTRYPSIAMISDGGDYEIENTAGVLRFLNTSKDAKMTIDQDGNIDIAGSVKMTGFQLGDSTTAGYVLVVDDSGIGTWQAIPASPTGPSGGISGQTVRHDGTDWVADSNIFNTGASVGIGMADPQSVLQVAGDITLGIAGNATLGSRSIIFHSASGNADVVENYWINAASEDDTCPGQDSVDAYFCSSGQTDPAYTCKDVAIPSGADDLPENRVKRNPDVTCYPDTDSYSVKNNAGVLEFVNSAGETKITFDQDGNIKAYTIETGDLLFRKDGVLLWRMFEDINGLYAENVVTGKTYKIPLIWK